MPIIDMEPPANFGSDTRVDTFHQPPCQEIIICEAIWIIRQVAAALDW